MVPSAFMLLAGLPRTPHGKLDRSALPLPDQARPQLEESFVAPRDELEVRMTKIWERILGIHPVGLKDNFFDLGGHSLLAVSLFTEIEKTFGKHLPLATLFQAPTIEQLAYVLRDEGWSPLWSSLVPIQSSGSKPPFFCVHANGGHVFFYRDLARHLGPDRPVYGLQAVGLDGKQPPLTRIEDMAAHYVEEIRSIQPQGPYFLGGFCLGAYVALEMSHQLQAQGQQVALLASFNTDGGWRKATTFRQGIDYHLRNLSQLRPEEKLTYIVTRVKYRIARIKNAAAKIACKLYIATGRKLPRQLLHLHMFELNHQASKAYVPRIHKGTLTYFQATADAYRDPRPFWSELVTGGVEVHVVPGKYLNVFTEPNVRALAEILRACLDRARTEA
jgi:thioesterase domain-containing protein/acyl carrier protein